jgi:hypothetical protein
MKFLFALLILGAVSAERVANNTKCTGMSKYLSEDDCNGWVDLFDATNGPHWWDCRDDRLDPCSCSAYNGGNGCGVNQFPYVLYLGGYNLTGTIPATFFKMDKIDTLVLHNNHVSLTTSACCKP